MAADFLRKHEHEPSNLKLLWLCQRPEGRTFLHMDLLYAYGIPHILLRSVNRHEPDCDPSGDHLACCSHRLTQAQQGHLEHRALARPASAAGSSAMMLSARNGITYDS